jgi:hypothetical protein
MVWRLGRGGGRAGAPATGREEEPPLHTRGARTTRDRTRDRTGRGGGAKGAQGGRGSKRRGAGGGGREMGG